MQPTKHSGTQEVPAQHNSGGPAAGGDRQPSPHPRTSEDTTNTSFDEGAEPEAEGGLLNSPEKEMD